MIWHINIVIRSFNTFFCGHIHCWMHDQSANQEWFPYYSSGSTRLPEWAQICQAIEIIISTPLKPRGRSERLGRSQRSGRSKFIPSLFPRVHCTRPLRPSDFSWRRWLTFSGNRDDKMETSESLGSSRSDPPKQNLDTFRQPRWYLFYSGTPI